MSYAEDYLAQDNKRLEIANEQLRARVAELESQLAQLKRPPMTRELPQEPGLYWRVSDAYPEDYIVVLVSRHYMTGQPEVFEKIGIQHEYNASDFSNGLWSARPIEMDPMPEGGE